MNPAGRVGKCIRMGWGMLAVGFFCFGVGLLIIFIAESLDISAINKFYISDFYKIVFTCKTCFVV